MSMHYGLYLGPYLKCQASKEIDCYELTDGRLCGKRGEFESDDAKGVEYIGPNIHVPGINRKMTFEMPNTSVTELHGMVISEEIAAFMAHFISDIQVLKKHYMDIEIKWGAVPFYR